MRIVAFSRQVAAAWQHNAASAPIAASQIESAPSSVTVASEGLMPCAFTQINPSANSVGLPVITHQLLYQPVQVLSKSAGTS